MTELARLVPGDKVLEIGTGSGYQAAVLAELGAFVYSIEIMADLALSASNVLMELGYDVNVRSGDGYRGWPEQAPFDAIIVTAAPVQVPGPLVEQLKVRGRMVIPVGELRQDLMVITRGEAGLTREVVLPVRFVPMTGEVLRAPP
jgi:protein-L-isoaspartate(D-aspartate) O-methyltransferase